MYICDLVHAAKRPDRFGAVIIDFRAARAASLVKRCKGPPHEVKVLIGALLHADAKTFPTCVFPIPDEILIEDDIVTGKEVAIEWEGRPRFSDLLLAESVTRRLGYRTGTHAVGNGGFTFLSVAA